MKTPIRLWLYAALIIGAAIAGRELASAAGGASNIVTSVTGTDLVPIDSGTLASDAQLSTLATYFNSGTTGNATFGTGVNQITLTGAATGSPPVISAGGASSDTNTALAVKGKGTGNVLIGGATTSLAGLQVTQTASAVNDFVLTNAATGNTPGFEAGGAGSDAAVGVAFGTVGTGNIAFDTGLNLQQFGVTHTASAVDYLACTGAATANPASIPCTATGTDTNANINLVSKGSGIVNLGVATASTCSGTTTATCQGQRFVVSITGLSTAASTLSAAMTVTNANVLSSSSNVLCQTQGYAGTGVPVVVNIVPGTGNVAMKVQNVSTGAALNATVAIACLVLGS